MELKQLAYESLYFPKEEWQWLRPSARYEEGPASFVWAATVGTQLYAWHPKGTTLQNGFAGQKLNVLILSGLSGQDTSELTAFGLFLKTSFATQAPQDVEWVNALSVLEHRFHWNSAEKGLAPFWRETLMEANLEPHLGTLSQRSRHLFLKKAEIQQCFDRKWDPATFELVASMPMAVRVQFLEAIKTYNLSANHAKECTHFALILTKKYSEKSALDVLSKKYSSVEEFRTALFKLAQPELARLSEARIEKLRKLHLPPRTSVFGDPSFEKDVLKITHNPRTTSDWEAFKEWVERPEVIEKIRDLLDLYQ